MNADLNFTEQIKSCYASAKNYPDLAKRLSDIGIQSYTVDTATSTILYRFADGEHIIRAGDISPRSINELFNEEKTIASIRNNQQGKSDYPGFMNEIAAAGVRFYEATLVGYNRRVTYIGYGGYYEEAIPG